MRTHADIVRGAGEAERVAQDRGVSVHTVRSWIQRDSIPAEYWPSFANGDTTVIAELVEGARPRKRPAPQERAA